MPDRHAIAQRTRGSRPWGPRIGFWLGVAAFFGLLFFVEPDPARPAVGSMAAIAVLMAIWWITDAIPLAATALLPLVLFPLLGVLSGAETAPVYVNSVVFLFIGGFMIALAMEQWGLHQRIAWWIIRRIGGGPSRLVLSFMVASAFLSMWISNTATAIMMLAIALAIIGEQERLLGAETMRRHSTALLLGVAYGASIGGLATLVGTPPNLAFVRIMQITFPAAPPVSFGQWMLFGLPLSVLLLLIVWLLLTRVFYRTPEAVRLGDDAISEAAATLGPMSFAERAVLGVFATTAMLWLFRADLSLGGLTVPGWTRLLPDHVGAMMDDGVVAVAMALLLFLIPSGVGASAGGPRRLLDHDVFGRIPWAVVLLFGGGFALAEGFQASGLSAVIVEQCAGLEGAPPVMLVGAAAGGLTFLTELTSNTATTQLMLPVLGATAESMQIHPLLLMIPATISASLAFMMPVATPPNAIIFGSGRVRIAEMAKVGFVINLIGVVCVTVLFMTLGRVVFEIDDLTPPAWATPAVPSDGSEDAGVTRPAEGEH